jgi:5-carboxymethyl-2-hydroxymuconate isomerase
MPHLVILYTADLDAQSDMGKLCRTLADALLSVKDEELRQVFPTGGVRVLAFPAAHHAVADGARDYAFVYLNLRMGRGRAPHVHAQAGEMLMAAAKRHFEPILKEGYIGMTLQIDEGREVFTAKQGNLHSLFTAERACHLPQ